jgi:uncharacterized protein DUF955
MDDRFGGTSALADWLCQTTGAVTPRKAIADRCAELVSATGDRYPPTRTGRLAQLLGLEPGPRARAQIPRGMLDLDTGRIYVSLFRPVRPEGPLDLEAGVVYVRDQADQFRPLTFDERARMRFSCAHELGHALFYDFSTLPCHRVAPVSARIEEERLCNHAARHLLLPANWVEPEFAAHPCPSLTMLRSCAGRYLVSLRVAAARAAEWFSPRLATDEFYLLSHQTTNVAGGGVKKPRCLGVFLSRQLRSEGVSFLAGYQVLNAVRRLGAPRCEWSLPAFHASLRGRHRSDIQSGPHVEVLCCPDGTVVRLDSTHFRHGSTTMVWTEGRIEILARTARMRQVS